MNELLTIKDLNISIKENQRTIVEGVSFSIRCGESVILLGQSGSGKTMTCRSIMNLLDRKKFQVSGNIYLYKKDIMTLKNNEKRKIYGENIAFIPQNPMTALNPSVRVGKQMDETLFLHSELTKEKRIQHILNCLSNTGLSEPERVYRSYPFMLSGGMLQRVLITMATMVNAELVIADEPTTALDVIHRNETIGDFCRLRNSGAGIFVVTHDFSAAAQLGGCLMVMKDGCILERGTVEEVLSNPQKKYTKELIEASSLSQKKGIGGVYSC